VAALELKIEGRSVPKIIVTTSDAKTESPVFAQLVESVHQRIRQFARENHLSGSISLNCLF
jgi:hypothetical protein